MKYRLDFEHLKKNMNIIADVLTIIRTLKDVVTQISKKSSFRRPFDKQPGKPSQTLLKSARQHLYDIY